MKKLISIKIWFFLLSIILVAGIGFYFGICFQEKKLIEIDSKIRYSELINFLTTIFIGIIVGYILKNKYENNKLINSYLLDDLKFISNQIKDTTEYCNNCRTCSSLNEDQRKEIISRVNILDKKIKNFGDLVKDAYESKYTEIGDPLINQLNSYNKIITSDGLYANPIQVVYFDSIISESSNFEGLVRKITLKIIKET